MTSLPKISGRAGLLVSRPGAPYRTSTRCAQSGQRHVHESRAFPDRRQDRRRIRPEPRSSGPFWCRWRSRRSRPGSSRRSAPPGACCATTGCCSRADPLRPAQAAPRIRLRQSDSGVQRVSDGSALLKTNFNMSRVGRWRLITSFSPPAPRTRPSGRLIRPALASFAGESFRASAFPTRRAAAPRPAAGGPLPERRDPGPECPAAAAVGHGGARRPSLADTDPGGLARSGRGGGSDPRPRRPERDVPDQSARGGPGIPPYLLAGFGQNFERRFLPCLIHWPEGFPPLEAEHRREPVGITGLDVAGPVDVIEDWCGAKPEGLRTVPGTSGPLRVEVGFADGESVTLGIAE